MRETGGAKTHLSPDFIHASAKLAFSFDYFLGHHVVPCAASNRPFTHKVEPSAIVTVHWNRKMFRAQKRLKVSFVLGLKRRLWRRAQELARQGSKASLCCKRAKR